MRIDINLASRPYQDSRQFWSYWGTALGLLALLTAGLLFLAITGYRRAAADRAQLAKLETEIAAYNQEKTQAIATLNLPQNRVLREQSHFLNDLFERKAFSWTRVFEDLERVMPAHLHLVSIHPGMSQDNNLEIKFQVGGDSLEQAQDLVRKMEQSNHFKETRIESERFADEKQNQTTDRVQFEIAAIYVPSVAETNSSSGGMH